MARVVFGHENQIDFFERIKAKSKLSRNILGGLVGISGRQYGDWSRGRFLPRKDAVEFLSKKFGVVMPQIIELRGEWWSAKVNGKKGGVLVAERYGAFGSLDAKKKGGRVSQLRRKNSPNYYRKIGCNVANAFVFPRNSTELAEFIGIVLGDGGLQKRQLHITLNGEADADYIDYIKDLVVELFGYQPSMYRYEGSKAVTVGVSGVNLVNFLVSKGLRTGNKVKQQVGVPSWITADKEYARHCLRGLVDTDGCIFFRRGSYKNKSYKHMNLYFSNSSQPLLEFAYNTLKIFGFNPKYFGGNNVRLYSEKEVVRYLSVIGSSNYRLNRKLRV